jgi:hypothetical protein
MESLPLQPTDGKKSFYGKCAVNIYNHSYDELISYNTIVAIYDWNTKIMHIHGYYSPTTARHINAYLQYHGFKKASKKELENWTPCTRDNQ